MMAKSRSIVEETPQNNTLLDGMEHLLQLIDNPYLQIYVDVVANEVSKLNNDQRRLYESVIAVKPNEIKKICMETVEQNHKSNWKNVRSCRITGSIVYNMFTYTSNKSPDWQKKLSSLYNSKFKGIIGFSIYFYLLMLYTLNIG